MLKCTTHDLANTMHAATCLYACVPCHGQPVPRFHTPYLQRCLLVCWADMQGKDPRAYATYMATRPPKFEQDAIKAIVDVLDADRAPVKAGWGMHIVHLADAGAISMVKVRQEGQDGCV